MRVSNAWDVAGFLAHTSAKSQNGGFHALVYERSAVYAIPPIVNPLRLSGLGAPSRIVRWLLSYFTKRRQRAHLNYQCLYYLKNNTSILQGAVHSPFIFPLYADSLTSSHIQLRFQLNTRAISARSYAPTEKALLIILRYSKVTYYDCML